MIVEVKINKSQYNDIEKLHTDKQAKFEYIVENRLVKMNTITKDTTFVVYKDLRGYYLVYEQEEGELIQWVLLKI